MYLCSLEFLLSDFPSVHWIGHLKLNFFFSFLTLPHIMYRQQQNDLI